MLDRITVLCRELTDDEKLQLVVHLHEGLLLGERMQFARMVSEENRLDLLTLLKKIERE